MVKQVDEGEGQDARAMIELEKLLGIGEGEGREAQGMKELEELLGIVDVEKVGAGDVKKAPRGKELGKILARRMGKPADEKEEQGVRTMEELRKRLESIDAKRKGRPVDLERWLRQQGK